MRYTIATTKKFRGTTTFSRGNLNKLANFSFLPIKLLHCNTTIGSATEPKISECGNILSAELKITEAKYLNSDFSVGYIIKESAFSVEQDKYIITDLEIKTVFPTLKVGMHD